MYPKYTSLTRFPRQMCTYLLMLIITIVKRDTMQDKVHRNPSILQNVRCSSNHCLPNIMPKYDKAHNIN